MCQPQKKFFFDFWRKKVLNLCEVKGGGGEVFMDFFWRLPFLGKHHPQFQFLLVLLNTGLCQCFFSIVEIFKRSFVFSNYKSCCFWWHSPCHRAAHHAQMMKQTEDMILLFLLANISLRLDAAIISSLSANFFQINFNHCNTTNFCHLRLARQQALVNLWREMGL